MLVALRFAHRRKLSIVRGREGCACQHPGCAKAQVNASAGEEAAPLENFGPRELWRLKPIKNFGPSRMRTKSGLFACRGCHRRGKKTNSAPEAAIWPTQA
jgi:hypothetical protein